MWEIARNLHFCTQMPVFSQISDVLKVFKAVISHINLVQVCLKDRLEYQAIPYEE